MANWLNIFFGCSHANHTFPQTVGRGMRRSQTAALTGTYVVCLDCGTELAYDWNAMMLLPANSANAHSYAKRISEEIGTQLWLR